MPDGGHEGEIKGTSKDGSVSAIMYYDSSWSHLHGFEYTSSASTDIGTLGGSNIKVRALSADGKVMVGDGTDVSGTSHAFIYEDGVLNDLGYFGYDGAYVKNISLDGNTLVGYFYDITCDCDNAYKYSNGTFTNLTGSVGSDSYANAVSGDGSVIVGKFKDSGEYKAFELDNGTFTNIGNIVGATNSEAIAVSANGSAIIGTSSSGIFYYKDGTATNIETLGTSSIGGENYRFDSYSNKQALLSADGSVAVGTYALGSSERGFQYKSGDGTVSDLGTLGGSTTKATAVSADGSIIAGVSTNSSGDLHLFKYVGGQIYDLGTTSGGSTVLGVQTISADGSTIMGYFDDDNVFVFKTGLTADTSSVDAYSSSSSSSTSSINLTNTYSELGYNQNQLNSIINLRSSVLRSTLNQECNKFGENGFCVGASYRYSSVSRNHANQNVANVLKFAYQPTERLRFGMVIDQAFSENDPNNFTAQNSQPLVSFYGKFSQNVDGSGLGLKLAAASSKSKLWIKRSNQLSDTENGAGSSVIQSKAFLVEASYLKSLSENFALKPYAILRKTSVKRNAYTEVQNAAFPISFNVAAQNLTTAIFGIDSTLKITKSLSASLGFGMENNFKRSVDGYSGNINSVGNFSFESPSLRQKTAFVNAGLSYDLDQVQRIALDSYYGSQALNKANAATVYLSYYLGF